MSFRFNKPLAFALGAVGSLLVVSTFLWLLWLRDVRNDRKHTVSVNATTPVFVGSGSDGGCHGTQLTTIERGATVPVQRIRYLKDCAVIDIGLPSRQQGYVVLGIGDVSVNPPLATR
jgi:hypothetical protein